MPASATVTITNPASYGSRASEVQMVARALAIAAQQIRAAGGRAASGTITGDGAVVLGSWTFTAEASS